MVCAIIAARRALIKLNDAAIAAIGAGA